MEKSALKFFNFRFFAFFDFWDFWKTFVSQINLYGKLKIEILKNWVWKLRIAATPTKSTPRNLLVPLSSR